MEQGYRSGTVLLDKYRAESVLGCSGMIQQRRGQEGLELAP
jgi:hypothetical protein